MPEVQVKTNIDQYWEVDCPLECGWEGRRNQHEGDAYNELAGHFRTQHPGYVKPIRYRRTVTYERVEPEANSE